MKMENFGKSVVLSATLAAWLLPTSVTADMITINDCSSSVANSVVDNNGCEFLTGATNDEPASVVSGMFGVDDWTKLGRVNAPENSDNLSGESGGLTIDATVAVSMINPSLDLGASGDVVG